MARSKSTLSGAKAILKLRKKYGTPTMKKSVIVKVVEYRIVSPATAKRLNLYSGTTADVKLLK